MIRYHSMPEIIFNLNPGFYLFESGEVKLTCWRYIYIILTVQFQRVLIG